MTVNSCTEEMKQVYACKLMYCTRFISPVHEFTVMYPFHFSSTWIYSHMPIQSLLYMSLQSCTCFIVLEKWNGYMTVSLCTEEMKRIHDCKLLYWRNETGWIYSHMPIQSLLYMSLQSCTCFISPVHEFTVMYLFNSSVHEITVMYPFHLSGICM
jgi:hypothetical protein